MCIFRLEEFSVYTHKGSNIWSKTFAFFGFALVLYKLDFHSRFNLRFHLDMTRKKQNSTRNMDLLWCFQVYFSVSYHLPYKLAYFLLTFLKLSLDDLHSSKQVIVICRYGYLSSQLGIRLVQQIHVHWSPYMRWNFLIFLGCVWLYIYFLLLTDEKK